MNIEQRSQTWYWGLTLWVKIPTFSWKNSVNRINSYFFLDSPAYCLCSIVRHSILTVPRIDHHQAVELFFNNQMINCTAKQKFTCSSKLGRSRAWSSSIVKAIADDPIRKAKPFSQICFSFLKTAILENAPNAANISVTHKAQMWWVLHEIYNQISIIIKYLLYYFLCELFTYMTQ